MAPWGAKVKYAEAPNQTCRIRGSLRDSKGGLQGDFLNVGERKDEKHA